jgi:hypothetical protein
MIRLSAFITKTRNLKRAAQALAPREHEIYIILFRVFTCPVKPYLSV